MIIDGKITKCQIEQGKTTMLVEVPVELLGLLDGSIKNYCSIHLDDGRLISRKQSRWIHATMADIGRHFGWEIEDIKQDLKNRFIVGYGLTEFSLSDNKCSMSLARDFQNFLINFVLCNGIPVSAKMWSRTDDIWTYVALCNINKKCAVCGLKGEIHELTGSRIGMGNNRRKVSMNEREQICLCREHHSVCHMDESKFLEEYKLFGILHEDWKKYEKMNEFRNCECVHDYY